MQYLGLRGICYVELTVESLGTDVHSGLGGSIFPNAAWRLTWALNSLKGPDERIRIPGLNPSHQVQVTGGSGFQLRRDSDRSRSRFCQAYAFLWLAARGSN